MRCRSLLILIVLSTLAYGCGPRYLARKANKLLPPVDPTEERLKAIAAAQEGLDRLPSADVYIGLPSELLNLHLAPKLIESLDGLDEVEFSSGPQELQAGIEFSGEFDLGSNLHGRFRATGTIFMYPAVVGTELRFRPMLKADVKLKKLRINDRSLDAIKSFLEEVVNSFANNLNGLIDEQAIPLGFSFLDELKTEDLFSSLEPEAYDRKTLQFFTSLEAASVLVDEYGIHALATLEYTASSTARRLVDEYEDDGYDLFKLAFISSAQTIDLGLEPGQQEWQSLAIFAAKKFLAGTINESVSAFVPLCAAFAVRGQSQTFSERIRTEPAPNLNCGQHRSRDCRQTRSCDQHRDCNPRWGCPSCEWYQVDCHARKAGCEADKVRYRYQCELEKGAARAACEAEKAAAKAGCEIEKAARIKGCELNQGWLDLWGEMAVADIDGSASFSEAQARLCLFAGAVDLSLSEITFRGTLSASTTATARFTFTPLNAGHIVCHSRWSGNLTAAVIAPEQEFTLFGRLTPTSGEPKELSLAIRAEDEIDLFILPPPLLSLPLQNPQMLAFCPLVGPGVAAGAGLSASVRSDLINSHFPQKVPEIKSAIQIPDLEIELGGSPTILRPVWREHSAGWFDF